MWYTVSKGIFVFLVFLALLNLIASFVPSSFTDSLNDAIIYFLTYINYLQPFVNVSTIFICIKIITNFIVGVASFFVFSWAIRAFITL